MNTKIETFTQRLLHNYWFISIVIVGGCLGVLTALWWLADGIRYKVLFILTKDSSGIDISGGKYLINIWIVFITMLVFFLLIAGIVAIFVTMYKFAPDSSALRRLDFKYNDLLSRAKKIASNFVSVDANSHPQIDVLSLVCKNVINSQGSSTVTRTYKIRCPRGTAHAFRIRIVADDESDAVDGFDKLQVRIEDTETRKELNWIPCEDSLRLKDLVIFYPELNAGDTMSFKVKYFWPGLMKKIITKGSTEHYWNLRNTSEAVRTNFTYEWEFFAGFPPVQMQKINTSDEATLTQDGSRWTYHNPRMPQGRFAVNIQKHPPGA